VKKNKSQNNNYTYTVTGTKLKVVHRWNPVYFSAPVVGSAVNIGSLTEKKTVDYVGNKIYTNSALEKILTKNSYYSDGMYYFYVRDHLGNNCVVVNANGSTQQGTYYHPFGKSIENCESYNRSFQPYKYGGKEEEQMHGMGLYDFGARQLDEMVPGFLTVDPLCEKYYSVSPYVYCLNNPVKFVDPDGRVVRLANNYAGGMENIAKIAATSLGSQVMSHLIGRNETYTLNSTFWTSSSSYDPRNGNINYVGSPWHSEIPFDGGALNSMIAMGHETFHAFDNSNYIFNAKNAAYSRDIVEPRAVSFGNYLRQSYSLSPLREGYGNIQGNFHQFPSNEKISDFTTLGNSSDKTSYGFSYTKTTTIVESYKKGFLGMKIPDKTRTETTMHYMTVSRDKNNNASFQIYDNEEAYKKATSNW
jgi:RHS repeat-associated protein